MFLITIVLQDPVAETRIVLECPSDLEEHRFGPRPTVGIAPCQPGTLRRHYP
jgi:hypothetical protein